MLTDEMRYKLIRLFQANPEMSQRDAAKHLGISVGKVNYCLQALSRTGLIKAKRFRNNKNKAAYVYLLTPRGIEAKGSLALRFLQIKMQEYEMLRAEIEDIRREFEGVPSR